MKVTRPDSLGIRHVALAARDLKRAHAFYVEILGFEPYYTGDSDWEMYRKGDTSLSLILHRGAQPKEESSAPHPAHFGLNVDSNKSVDEWHGYLAAKKAPHLTAPTHHRDGSYGFYLKDTEGNPLEVIFIPKQLAR